MDGGDGNVRGIGDGLGRQSQGFDQGGGELAHVISDVQERKVLERVHPPACRCRVASARFVEDELRNEDLEGASSRLPPFFGDLLVPSADEIPAWPGGQVAGHRCFQAKLRLHCGLCSSSTEEKQGGEPQLQQFSFWNFSAFGVHALACLAAADTLKGGHQTPQIRQNENRCHNWEVKQIQATGSRVRR